MPRRGDLLGGQGLVLGPAGHFLGHDHIDREDDLNPVGLGLRQNSPRVVHAVGLGEALADRLALGEQERVGHAAPEDEHVDVAEEMVDDLDLVRHLGSAKDGGKRPLGRLEELREHLDLALHQQAGVRRQQPGNAHG